MPRRLYTDDHDENISADADGSFVLAADENLLSDLPQLLHCATFIIPIVTTATN